MAEAAKIAKFVEGFAVRHSLAFIRNLLGPRELCIAQWNDVHELRDSAAKYEDLVPIMLALPDPVEHAEAVYVTLMIAWHSDCFEGSNVSRPALGARIFLLLEECAERYIYEFLQKFLGERELCLAQWNDVQVAQKCAKPWGDLHAIMLALPDPTAHGEAKYVKLVITWFNRCFLRPNVSRRALGARILLLLKVWPIGKEYGIAWETLEFEGAQSLKETL
jgi:hypothetical protein